MLLLNDIEKLFTTLLKKNLFRYFRNESKGVFGFLVGRFVCLQQLQNTEK